MQWIIEKNGYTFFWDIGNDLAALTSVQTGKLVWRGTLLPGFDLLHQGSRIFRKARAVVADLDETGGIIQLELEGIGTGTLQIAQTASGCEFERLDMTWTNNPPALISLYFGVDRMTSEQRDIVPNLDNPFWPNWAAQGFCIPSAKGAPIQSFFRSWDFGHATLPLGNFGPALGTPYAAAFPRPLLCAALGGDDGWLVLGCAAIPDAAMTLDIRSSNGCLNYRYREDLWGAPTNSSRAWEGLLRLSWQAEAWDAYNAHFKTFDVSPVDPQYQLSQWNTWGEYRFNIFKTRRMIDVIANDVKSEVFVFDDKWETYPSSGVPNRNNLPDFEGDLAYLRERGLKVGLWQAVGWTDDPEAAGLTRDDLLCGSDGNPRRASWSMNPHVPESAHYCLDPSSTKVREYLHDRVRRIVRDYQADLLKLDFGYGLPGPDVAVPRDPAYRGERMAYTLYQLVADAAREVNPKIILQSWGISPLMRPAYNMVSLDDLGDAGSQEAIGHRQWSVWAALAGQMSAAIMASSGYDWASIPDILLNTAVIGAPGGVSGIHTANDTRVSSRLLSLLRALMLWYRRSTRWTPLWLNTEKGSLQQEPLVRCWGRLEPINGEDRLTALALRDGSDKLSDRSLLRQMDWSGRWAIIAQDDADIYASKRLACIPFEPGRLLLPCPSKPKAVQMIIKTDEIPYLDWKWSDGMLSLDMSFNINLDELTGFLILR